MKKITIYTAYAGHDTWDGASWSKLASFSNYEDARKAAQGKYSGIGSNAPKNGKVEPEEINIFESYEEFKASNNEEKKRAALEKLSKEEIDILGLEK